MIKIAPLTPMYTEYFKLIELEFELELSQNLVRIELEFEFEFEFCILGLKFYIIIL